MPGPLSEIKVLDFSTLLPGPYATMLMADMGAEVTRIESPERPDLLRISPPLHGDMSYAHLMINRNKRSVAIDLKHPEAKRAIEALVRQSDVVIEQFRPGVMKRLGLDYDSLSSINPGLIYCSITGYGQTGPMKDRAGHDINYLALSGLASYSGKAETGPVLNATQIADVAGGSHHAVMAILAAVIERSRTANGQYLDISMSDAAFGLNTMFAAGVLATDEDIGLGESMLNGGCFYDYYQTSDERYMAVGGLEPQFVMAFFAALGHPEWAAEAALPIGKQQRLKDKISDVIKARPYEHWVDVFSQVDACVEGVLTINEAAKHPQYMARNMTVDVALDNEATVTQVAPAIKFDSTEPSMKAGRQLGADSRQVFLDAGLSEQEVEQMLSSDLLRQA